jgi:hypothetical protein
MPEQPQRHRDTEKAQSQPPAHTYRRRKSTQRRGAAETQRESRQLDRPARSRPPGGRISLARTAALNANVHRGSPGQRPALSESAGLASHVDQNPAFEQVRTRRDRRAIRLRPWATPRHVGASAGGKSDRDGCSHPERSGFSPGAGASRHCRRSTPGKLATAGTAPLRLCTSAPLRFLSAVRLCVSVPLWFSWCLGSSKTLQSRT